MSIITIFLLVKLNLVLLKSMRKNSGLVKDEFLAQGKIALMSILQCKITVIVTSIIREIISAIMIF